MSAPANVVIQTFNTHQMRDEVIARLKTARDDETAAVMNAVERNLRAAPGLLQHVAVYGTRGFGKSFLARVVQMEVAALSASGKRVIYVLLPEEQHNLTRNPHALLDYISAELDDLRRGEKTSWRQSAFKWPRPDKEEVLWGEAAAKLEQELDASLPDGNGIVIVVVENFDALLESVFKQKVAEQRLRKWLGRDGNRVMLLATATGTADLDYDRPLFQALQPVRLSPWSQDDCIRYFNRRRCLEGKDPLDRRDEAKARAIADFIGGNPRLAQLLSDVLDTQDALTVAEIMNALADKLADYYQRRITDLPPLAQGLLDTLIRGGEPCSATELAARAGTTQSDIARVMQDLRRADIIRGEPAPQGRQTLFRVTDRVFVHFYRLRQGEDSARGSPLLTILDFIKTFYTHEELVFQASRYLEAGRPAEADVFRHLAEAISTTRAEHSKILQEMRECADNLFQNKKFSDALEVEDRIMDQAAAAGVLSAQLISVIRKAACLVLLDRPEDALAAVDTAVPAAEKSGDEFDILVLLAVRPWLHNVLHQYDMTIKEVAAVLPRAALAGKSAGFLLATLYSSYAKALVTRARYDDAILAADDACKYISDEQRSRVKATVLMDKGRALDRLSRFDEAASTYAEAASLFEGASDALAVHKALLDQGQSLYSLGRTQESMAVCSRSFEIAESIGKTNGQIWCAILISTAALDLKLYDEAWQWYDRVLVLALTQQESRPIECLAMGRLTVASFISKRDALDIVSEWILRGDGHLSTATFGQEMWAAVFLAAAVRAGAWSELDRVLTQRLLWFAANLDPERIGSVGGTLGIVFSNEGRPAAFAAARNAFSRLSDIVRAASEYPRAAGWLKPIVAQFATACRDAGMLGDIAGLITDDMAADAALQRDLLLRLAEFDAGNGDVTSLARVDPDVATWIKRIRGLSDSEVKATKKSKSGPRKLRRG